VSAGTYHTCAVTTDGKVRCWGDDCNNQLGDGKVTEQCTLATYSTTPVEVVGVSGATAVAAGCFHTCAIVTGGKVWCWGTGSSGELGSDEGDSSASGPVEVALGSKVAKAITAGRYHSCALLDDDTVECWGDNAYRALGNGNDDSGYTAWTPEPVVTAPGPGADPLDEVVAVATNYNHTCAARSDKAVYCWGTNYWAQLGDGSYDDHGYAVLAQGVQGEAVAVGKAHSCALDAGGAIACWGYGEGGELGDGSADDSVSPLTVDLSSFGSATALVSGADHSCAILDNTPQTAVCWGENTYGEIGDGSYSNQRDTPADVLDLSQVTAMAGGDSFTCAIVHTQDNPGAVYCWGYGWWGQLGDGYDHDRSRPVLVKGF
jgi:alpha-tubulin suppressor-like RCC1 family protein